VDQLFGGKQTNSFISISPVKVLADEVETKVGNSSSFLLIYIRNPL